MPLSRLKSSLFILAILLFAFALRLSIFDYGLPYVDNVDEPNFYLLANDWRGALSGGWRNEWLEGYPPGYIWFYGTILNGISDQNIHTDMGSYVAIMRLVSVLADMLTLAWIIRLAGWFGGEKAKLLCASLYAVSPALLTYTIDALPDPMLSLLILCSTGFAVQAFRNNDSKLAILSTIFGLAAIVFKYPAAPVLTLPALFFLQLLWRERLKALPIAFVALALVLLTAYLLLFVYGAAGLNNAEAVNARTGFLSNLLMMKQWRAISSSLFSLAGLPYLLLILLSLPFAFRQKMKHGWLIFFVAVQGFLLVAVVAGYFSKQPSPTRYIWGGSILLLIATGSLFGLAFQRKSWAWLLVPLPLLFSLPGVYQLVELYNRPMTFTLLQPWVEENIPDESAIWIEDYWAYRSLIRYEGGYPGFKNFGMVYLHDNRDWQGSPTDVDYIYLSEHSFDSFPSATNWPELSEFTLLKHIDSEGRHGPDLYFYTTDPLASQTEILWQNADTRLLLRGIQLEYLDRTIDVNSYWQAQTPIHRDYSYSLYLTPANEPASAPVAQQDSGLGQRPTSRWNDTEEVLQVDIAPFTLDTTLPAGEYDVWIAIYYWETGERLLLEDGSSALNIGSIRVE